MPGDNVAIKSIRQAMAAVDPGMPITFVRTLKEEVFNYFTHQRFIARLTSFFGILSFLLASMGIYGVTGYNVGRRNNEIGVRIAVGQLAAILSALYWEAQSDWFLFGSLIGLPLAFGRRKRRNPACAKGWERRCDERRGH